MKLILIFFMTYYQLSDINGLVKKQFVMYLEKIFQVDFWKINNYIYF